MEGEFDGNLTCGFQFLNTSGTSVLQANNTAAVPSTGILLNNQSSVDVFHNAKLLRNICEAKSCMDQVVEEHSRGKVLYGHSL
jgi:hypothetical protein